MRTSVFEQEDRNIQENINELILDLPIAAENKLRAKMLVAIFTSYGKYQLNRGIEYPKVNTELVTILSNFKDKNGAFCTSDYTTKVLENVGQYASYKAQLKREITQSFLADSSTYLKKHVENTEVLHDLEKAEEALYVEQPSGIYGLTLADHYLTQCKNEVKKYCNLHVDFINAI